MNKDFDCMDLNADTKECFKHMAKGLELCNKFNKEILEKINIMEARLNILHLLNVNLVKQLEERDIHD